MVAFFGSEAVPPLTLVEWQSKNPIEIELIVAGDRKPAGDSVEYLTPPGLKTSPVFSRVARVNRGDLIYVSGLYGPAPINRRPAGGVDLRGPGQAPGQRPVATFATW